MSHASLLVVNCPLTRGSDMACDLTSFSLIASTAPRPISLSSNSWSAPFFSFLLSSKTSLEKLGTSRRYTLRGPKKSRSFKAEAGYVSALTAFEEFCTTSTRPGAVRCSK